jgi:succinate-semialdehyde dehydrogenase/glutarate-semialdehyde dehydrogenase
VDAAEQAAKAWAATAPRVRAKILQTCFEKLMENVDWLANLISLENGKSLTDARGEVVCAAEFFRWYSEEAVRINGELGMAPAGTNRIMVQYQPIGISLLITPWNLPAAVATRKIAPALTAGCACILNPAEKTPPTALAIAQILLGAGVPPGVVDVITTSETGGVVKAILHDARVRKLSFYRLDGGRRSAVAGKRPTTSSVHQWSSAATRLSWSSTTPTWTRPSKVP